MRCGNAEWKSWRVRDILRLPDGLRAQFTAFRIVCPIVVCFGLIGCASRQLQISTARQASTVADLQYQQVLDNLAMYSTNPERTQPDHAQDWGDSGWGQRDAWLLWGRRNRYETRGQSYHHGIKVYRGSMGHRPSH